jgi:hypothetical protein
MAFPPNLHDIDEVVELVQRIRDAGSDVKVDGWSAQLLRPSKLDQAIIQEVRDYREAVIFHFIVECPTTCVSCWGVGVKQNEEGEWFCTAHYPDKMQLYRLAKAQSRMSDQITEYANKNGTDNETYKKMLDDHQRRGDVLAGLWKSIEPNYPSTL